MRITTEILEKKLSFINREMGKVWCLDYYGGAGGYVVVEVDEKTGGQRHPLLNKRLPASQMADALDMALAVLIEKKRGN